MNENLTSVIKNTLAAVIMAIATIGSVAIITILVLLPIAAVMGWKLL